MEEDQGVMNEIDRRKQLEELAEMVKQMQSGQTVDEEEAMGNEEF